MAKLSGLQRDVLSFYRECLREVRKKPVEARKNFQAFARSEFQKYRHINKKDFTAVEYLLRKGRRQLSMYALPGIRNVQS